jgi:hypothetical protein
MCPPTGPKNSRCRKSDRIRDDNALAAVLRRCTGRIVDGVDERVDHAERISARLGFG